MEEYSKYPVEVISGIAEETGMGMYGAQNEAYKTIY